MIEKRLSSEIILALGRHRKTVFANEYANKKVAERCSSQSINSMVRAEKFHISNDLLDLIVGQAMGDFKDLLSAMICGQPPYPLMWLEWDEDYRLQCEKKHWEKESNRSYPDIENKKFGKHGCLITSFSESLKKASKQSQDNYLDLMKSSWTKENFDKTNFHWIDYLNFSSIEFQKKLMIAPFSSLVDFNFTDERIDASKPLGTFASSDLKYLLNDWSDKSKVHYDDLRVKSAIAMLGSSWSTWWADQKSNSKQEIINCLVPVLDRIRCGQHSMSPLMVMPEYFSHFQADPEGNLSIKKAGDILGCYNTQEGDLRFILHALACLNSPEVQREFVKPKPNKKYVMYGVKVPCSEYKTLNLVLPKTKRIVYLNSELGGHGSPKRFHQRRGHWRNYRNGKMVWVKHCSVGNEELGRIHHEYNLEKNEHRKTN